MDWQPYGTCCQNYAGDSEVGFCPECGHAFLRCQAFAECRSLVTPDGRAKSCPVCIAPQLMIDPRAVVKVKKGDRLSIPLILINASPAGRPLWVKRIVKKMGDRYEPLALTWEQVEAGTERRFSLDLPPMVDGGTVTAGLILVLASRYKGAEEEYAFEAEMLITIAAGQDGNTTVNITNTNSTYYAPVRGQVPEPTPEPSAGPTTLNLQPAEVYELAQGIRGYSAEKIRVPRHVEFQFAGFPPDDIPGSGAITARGRLACGRNSRTPDPAAKAVPSDLSLRAYDRHGAVDEPATMAISRHHFDLVVLNDRLCVHARSTRGLELNGRTLDSGEIMPLAPGDRLVPIPGRADKLSLEIDFATSMGWVDRVEITRTPSVNGSRS